MIKKNSFVIYDQICENIYLIKRMLELKSRAVIFAAFLVALTGETSLMVSPIKVKKL
ncbi:hypothetical protein AB7942_30425 [Neobacillus sp. BF23-41]|uniref:hypothetical protein n=1 Tax=Neobacillus sp. BF23-41 TaxID=3240280 RepID=UPI0034E3AEDD